MCSGTELLAWEIFLYKDVSNFRFSKYDRSYRDGGKTDVSLGLFLLSINGKKKCNV